VAGTSFVALAVLALATLYWGFLRADELAARHDNPRRLAFDRRIQRGALLDRWGAPLATTSFDQDGRPTRTLHVPAAAPVVGFQTWTYGAGAIDAAYGAAGAEAALDTALRGEIGTSIADVMAIRLLHRAPVGRDVRLSLDASLQAAAADLLGDRRGAIVLLDPRTGAVRAMASEPTFDPATLDSGPGHDEGRLLNRATHGQYPPGSIWKTVTLAGGLLDGLVDEGTVFDDGDAVEYFDGYPVRCDNNPDGVIQFDLAHAFAWSCNVTFARLAHRLGADRYEQLAASFGMGEAPPFLIGAAAGSLSADDELSAPELAAAGFGQGEIVVSPLHMALIAAAAAGDGTMPIPYLVEEVEGLGSRAIPERRGVWKRPLDPITASTLRSIMVTSGREGWAASAGQGLTVTIAGKTGTAETGSLDPHAWFIGFAPADDPRMVVAVLVEHGGEGSRVAAPIGGRALEIALSREESE
jgi:peptidoglycan glycosyltransferase